MRELGRLNRTETVAVQTDYVLARCGLQVSDAIASDAIANGPFVRISPRGASLCKSVTVDIIPRVALRAT